jgi:hypothetical protein
MLKKVCRAAACALVLGLVAPAWAEDEEPPPQEIDKSSLSEEARAMLEEAELAAQAAREARETAAQAKKKGGTAGAKPEFAPEKTSPKHWFPPMASFKAKAFPFALCHLYPDTRLILEDDAASAKNRLVACANPGRGKTAKACDCDQAKTRSVRLMEPGYLLGLHRGKLYWNAQDSETKGRLLVFDMKDGKKLADLPWRGKGFERRGSVAVDSEHRLTPEELAGKPPMECREMTEEETIHMNYVARNVATLTVDLDSMKQRKEKPRCDIVLEE